MTKTIPLTQDLVALVSDGDYARVMQHKWFASSNYANTAYASTYIGSRESRKQWRMHRFILSVEGGEEVDHADGNGLNNTRENIRVISHGLNVTRRTVSPRNKTGYIGVSRHQGRWRARIGDEYKTINVGMYDTAEEAAIARDLALVELYGEDAPISRLHDHQSHSS